VIDDVGLFATTPVAAGDYKNGHAAREAGDYRPHFRPHNPN